MADNKNIPRRFHFKISIFLVYGLLSLTPAQAQFTACTTRGNYTDDIYRDVRIKNSRTSVTISSPNFPQPYPQNIQCTWRILAPDGFQVKLSFLEFQLEKRHSDSSCHDYASVSDGGLVFKDAEEIWRRCGSSNPPAVRSSGQVLWMRFLSDKKIQEKGFTMKVVPVSGSPSKRYIVLGVLVALLFIIIVTIIVCRKRFQGKEKDAPKVRQYQELQVPTDSEPEQTKPLNEEPDSELTEDLLNSDRHKARSDKTSEALDTGPMKSSEGSAHCSLSDEGYLECINSRSISKESPKKATANEDEELECTELLTVV